MKKSMKLMSMLLAVALVVAVLPTAAFAVEKDEAAQLQAEVEELYEILPEDTSIMISNGEIHIATSDATALFNKIMEEANVDMPAISPQAQISAPNGGYYNDFGTRPGTDIDWPFLHIYLTRQYVDAIVARTSSSTYDYICDMIIAGTAPTVISDLVLKAFGVVISPSVITVIGGLMYIQIFMEPLMVKQAQDKSTTKKVSIMRMSAPNGTYNIYLPWNSDMVGNDYKPSAVFHPGLSYELLGL